MPDGPDIPTDEELAAFAVGQLPEDQCPRIEEYLESDPESESRWKAIVVDDSLLTRIRRSTSREPTSPASGNDTLAAGAPVGRYVVGTLLGRGGMGAVYQAHDPIIDRQVALKILPSSDETASERALLEARAQGKVNHTNIVTVYDADHFEHGVYIAMELMVKSMDDVLGESGPQSVNDAVDCLLAATKGLQAAHQVGLIHRDIKPANLLLSSDGVIKVADFGLAQKLDSQTIHGQALLAGTPHFMSPEQCRSEKADVRSDVYSLGAALYALLTGDKPYSDSESALQVLFAHCESSPPDPCTVRQDLPDGCRKIVQQAMAKRSEDRFADVSEFAKALSTLVARETKTTLNSTDSSQVWKQLAAIPTGPSLVVLPFENLSGDPEQEYFSDGITHEIISQLGRFGELNLVAGRSAFQYKGKATDLQQLRRDLGVQYVLEGTVRKSGNRIRISASLLNTETASVFWTQRFDKDLSLQDVIEIQDEVAENVASALAQPYGQLHVAEGSRRHEGAKINAYDAILRFYEYWRAETIDAYWPVRKELEATVESNPTYTQASAALALLYVNGYRVHQLETGWTDMEKASELARYAIQADPHCEMAHQAIISVHFHRNEKEPFALAAEKAVSSYPNHADLLADVGLFFVCLGKYSRGMAMAEKALALSPNPPGWYSAAGILHAFYNQDYQDALNRSFALGEGEYWTHLHRAVALAHLSRLDEAEEELDKSIDIYPDLVPKFREMFAKFNVNKDVVQRYKDGIRLMRYEIT